MHLTARSSGWRFQIRIPRSLEPCFGRVPVRLNLGPLPKRPALRVARLLAGHAERLFRAAETGDAMTDMSRDELVEELQELLVQVLADAESTIDSLRRQRELEVRTVTLRLQTERYRDQLDMQERLQLLGGAIDGLAKTAESLPKNQRNDIAAQLAALSAQVQQVLAGGPDKPMLLDELETWTELRKDHAQDKKVKTDANRIRDFVEYAGNKPVNRYRFSDFQSFTNVLARSPANMVKERMFHGMTREQAANHNDTLKERRFPTLTGKAIEANYLSPLRMFFKTMAAEHDFRSPLADMSPAIPNTARDSVVRVPFTVEELNIWFTAAAQESRPDLKWLPLLATLTGARVGELIFLQGKDIYRITDTLWVADLTTDLVIEGEQTERQIKNATSRRLFALHEVLEQTAFYDHCAKRKADEWLFPHAFRHGKELVKDPADAASKRLNGRLEKLGIHRPYETTFHSSRHTAKDIMRVAKIDPRTADRQTGHAMKSAGDNYGKKTLLVEEVEVLAALRLPEGLNLTPYITKPKA
ncbi:tyrosine-type recombinase/integrase [Devosia sp.]|uniref:tyrosine-type recombinase/integrase n=1 Tax=Devosia sp. TaxID=1871048 RepID=UPI001ACAE95B|nr:tyrosine-type recombinase/integrase [Devosia sp.]MBN9334517.1 tyrosine-type recombinase/integrase [Devosia sp.]